ncbi:MAG: hypothetical protein ACXWLB_27185, partial [Reyranella sp.]
QDDCLLFRRADGRARCRGRRSASSARLSTHQTPRFDRDRLPPGLQIDGPAIVEDAWSTIVVPPGYVLRADGMGHLWINEVVA